MKTINLVLTSLFLAGLALGTSGCPSDAMMSSTGTGGSGGGGSSGGACPSDANAMISEFTTSSGIEEVEGRSGGWYLFDDGSAGSAWEPAKVAGSGPPPDTTTGSPCSPEGSLHLKGTGFATWGAGLGTNFVAPTGTVKNTYDASKYTGVTFRIKAAKSVMHMQVKFPDINTDPEVASPLCHLSDGSDPMNCSPYLKKEITIPTDWTEVKVSFAETVQDQYNLGYKPADDMVAKSALTGVQIQINANYDASGMASPNDFEIWVDDVSFY